MSMQEDGWRGLMRRYPSSTLFLAYISLMVTLTFILTVVKDG